MLEIISISLSISLIIINFILLKSRDILTWEMKRGLICHSCRTPFETESLVNCPYGRLCKSCQRDRLINSLRFGGLSGVYRICDSFIFKTKIMFIYLGFVAIISLLQVSFMIFSLKINIVPLLYISNIFFWVFLTWKTIYITTKK